jgi:hypothetical protein
MALGAQQTAAAATPAAPRTFVRHLEGDDGGHVDVLVATYRRGDTTLALHAALPIADAEHAAAMQRRFTQFEALLLAHIPAAAHRQGNATADPETAWQTLLQADAGGGPQWVAMQSAFDLTLPNLVLADLTPDQIAAAQATAQQGVPLARHDAANDSAREQSRIGLAAAVRSGRDAHAVRTLAARQITAEALPPSSPHTAPALQNARIEKCLQVLQAQVTSGKRQLGLYGDAADLPRLEQRLVRELGWQPLTAEWLRAWDCRASRFKVGRTHRERAVQDLEALFAILEEWRAANPGAANAPTLAALRSTRPDGKLPGQADGVDPWGREFLPRSRKSGYEVRCLGGDGQADTEDDLAASATQPKGGNLPPSPVQQVHQRVRAAESEAKIATTAANVRSILELAHEYWSVHRRMSTVVDLATPDANGQRYLDEVVLDPWGHDFLIRAGERPGRFVVLSAGPDGAADTEDDISTPQKPLPQPAKK